MIQNKLGITSSAELAVEEERISKQKALELFMKGIDKSYEYEGYSHYTTAEIDDMNR